MARPSAGAGRPRRRRAEREGNGLEQGEIGPAPLRSRRRDDGSGEAVSRCRERLLRRITRPRWACRILSDGMLWQPRADHEQKQELGDVTITRGLDATRPITEALLEVRLSASGMPVPR